MENFLNEKGTQNLAENIKAVCDAFNTQFGNFECLHGVGHGVLAYLDYDLPGAIGHFLLTKLAAGVITITSFRK